MRWRRIERKYLGREIDLLILDEGVEDGRKAKDIDTRAGEK